MHQDPIKILNAAGANGIGTPILVVDFRHLILSLNTSGNASATIRIQGSVQRQRPAFGSAQSRTNPWDYLRITDLEDMSSIDGDTGIVLTGTDDHRQFEVETNGIVWLCPVISGFSAGVIDLTCMPRKD
jgi:hypothetical protein